MCRSAIAACRTYRPLPPRAVARSSSARPVGDLLVVPQRAILLVEQDELAVAEAGVAPRVVQEHQG